MSHNISFTQNPIFALSGLTENSLRRSSGQMNFIPAFDSDFQLDEKLIPAVRLYIQDHRGRKVLNSFKLNYVFYVFRYTKTVTHWIFGVILIQNC